MADSRATEPAGEELGARARRGMAWSLFNSGTARLLNVAAGMIVARVVTPDEFGAYTAALLVMTIVLSMNEAGLSVAVIRWKLGVDRIAPTAVSSSFASSAVWFALMLFGAPLIASLLNAPEATGPIRVLSLAILLDGVSTIPNALLMRAFQQRKRAIAQLVGFLVGSPIGILLAVNHGALGLATGLAISNGVATAIILWAVPERPRPGWDRATALELFRVGLPPALTSVLLLAIVNVDSIVVSRVLGVGALGFYALAFNVANWPWNLLSISIRQVSLPAFSRLAGDRPELERAFARSLTLAAGIAVLGGVLIAAFATPLVGILYGEKWLPAVIALQWLALLGALRVMLELCYDLLIAVGRAGALIRVQLSWLAALAVGLPIAARLGGIEGVAIGQGAIAAALVLPLNARLLAGSGIHFGNLLRALRPVLGAGATAAIVALAALRVGAPWWPTLLAGGALVTVAYAAAFLAARRGREALRWARGSGESGLTQTNMSSSPNASSPSRRKPKRSTEELSQLST
ncbi:MAG TPA: oligosaccharide flippase family protein [Solirubrobacterales bacterium]|nr:oligosaccharide flippase family protein [Solirubrobacterales bacterium]